MNPADRDYRWLASHGTSKTTIARPPVKSVFSLFLAMGTLALALDGFAAEPPPAGSTTVAPATQAAPATAASSSNTRRSTST